VRPGGKSRGREAVSRVFVPRQTTGLGRQELPEAGQEPKNRLPTRARSAPHALPPVRLRPRPGRLRPGRGIPLAHHRNSSPTELRQLIGGERRPVIRNPVQATAVGAVLPLEHEPPVPVLRVHQMGARRRRFHMPHSPTNSIGIGKLDQSHGDTSHLSSRRDSRLRRRSRQSAEREASCVPSVACVTQYSGRFTPRNHGSPRLRARVASHCPGASRPNDRHAALPGLSMSMPMRVGFSVLQRTAGLGKLMPPETGR
jgi:hypothetical protein